MSAIPVDVMVDILCRLPVKSLLRFKCLSKQFRSIIDDPDFIKRHLQNSSLDPSLIVEGRGRTLFSLELDSVDNAFILELPFVNWGYGCLFQVIGSCNGLLALSHDRGINVSLWNISTKKYQTLPPNFSSIFDGCSFACHGFGHDAASDDYKVVSIISCYDADVTVTEVSVYSLKGNCWRRIDGFPPYSTYYFHGMAAFVEGTLNWVLQNEDRRETLILSFDLKSEKFFEVPLPDTIPEAKEYVWSVMVLRGCLCLSCSNPFFRASDTIRECALDIWVMKEYGMKESWTKLVSLSGEKLPRSTMISCYISALVYSKRGDSIFIFQTEGEVLRYDLEKEKAETVEINGWRTLTTTGSKNIYVDSLVSPNVHE